MAIPKRPRGISKDDWDRMGMSQKIRALDSEGIKEGGKRMSSVAGRSLYAEADPRRASEFKGVMDKGGKFAKSLNDPKVRAQLGGRAIIKFNKKQLQAGSRIKGKPKMVEGADAQLSDLRRTVQEAVQAAFKKAAKQTVRAAKRLK